MLVICKYAIAYAITVQHGCADTVVMAMNVKYRKLRLGVNLRVAEVQKLDPN